MAAALHNGRLGCLDSFSWQKTPPNATRPYLGSTGRVGLEQGHMLHEVKQRHLILVPLK